MAAEPQAKIIDLLKANAEANTNSVSFEFFPPKTDAGDEKLYAALPNFKKQNPVFIDFTWGAGGTTSDKTAALCAAAKNKYGHLVNMHLTCTNMPQGKVKEALDFCVAHGIRNIVALRGDPPAGEEWKASEDGFNCALDLVKYIRKEHGDFFCLAVAGYPEGHPDKIDKETGLATEETMEAEMNYLKEKVDAGGDYIITQLFYDNQHFLKFVQRCRAKGINCPILPGMLPIISYGGFGRMTALCKTDVPKHIAEKLESIKDDDAAVKAYGVELTTAMTQELMANGIKHIHFYTLNLEAAAFNVMKNLGLYKEDA